MRNMINPFLEDIKGRRGLYDYLVVVDETNNTPERIDRNEMHGNIFLKPTKTAEFISLKFIATNVIKKLTLINYRFCRICKR